ncbi:hypothetical protein jhhlp_005345 [Lomentospora prolificans]|uniref:Cytochrome P450 n=1 Tax=Lomentospora prolificans TaxID=41688 RepID=A0A2N3N7I5_9PEZI|nr:hypothetical protein jhhlp_005345 [Lomentospora prolificans]
MASLSVDNSSGVVPTTAAAIAALPIAAYLINRLLFPTIDPREPPILRPTIPFIGHILSLIREQNHMFDRLYREKKLPICTLPMLNGSLYVINEPRLIAAAMRNQNLSFEPFSVEFAAPTLGMSKRHIEIYSQPGTMDKFAQVIHNSMVGDNLTSMNTVALGEIAKYLNMVSSEKGLALESGFEWLRELMALVTLRTLFGRENPLGKEALPDLWEFDKGLGFLALGIAPTLLAPKALAARDRLQKRLEPFYLKGLDQGDDVSPLMKFRGAQERLIGFFDHELTKPESSMLFVSTSNTIPTLFWLFSHIFADSKLLSKIRDEVETLVTVESNAEGGRTATLDLGPLEKQCPMLHAVYLEVLRLYSDLIGTRRVIEDTTLRDPVTGQEYFLRKGVNVQWCSKVAHHVQEVWGDDSEIFKPGRFINTTTLDEKKRRGALIPFGGGKHLCPGRNFARLENIGLVSALAIGFDLEGVVLPPARDAYLGTAMKRPEFGGKTDPIKITRRKGWEDVTWAFKC